MSKAAISVHSVTGSIPAKNFVGKPAWGSAASYELRDPKEILLQYAAPDDPHRKNPDYLAVLQKESLAESKVRHPALYEETSDEESCWEQT